MRWLGALATLAEDPGLAPSIHRAVHCWLGTQYSQGHSLLSLKLQFQGIYLLPVSTGLRHTQGRYTYMQTRTHSIKSK